MEISTPTLVLDKQKALNNIQNMSIKAAKNGLKFRPHFKTHQSIEVGNWFKKFDIDGITVSSIDMAEYFADNGWESITIAFPINILNIKRINRLSQNIDLRILVVDSESLSIVEDQLSTRIGIYIEIDPGYGRSGILVTDSNLIDKLINFIQNSQNLILRGFYCHAGHSYNCRSRNEVIDISNSVINGLNNLKNEYGISVCFGDTPCCSIMEDFGDIDELSPGNFVFYDLNQFEIGSCQPNDIAVAMYCPIVAKYPARKELLIHGGAVHFSKDFEVNNEGAKTFGQVVAHKATKWGEFEKGSYIKSLSQEHGIVKCTSDFFEETNVGDVVPILPIHSCLTADAMGSYITTDGEFISHLSMKKI